MKKKVLFGCIAIVLCAISFMLENEREVDGAEFDLLNVGVKQAQAVCESYYTTDGTPYMICWDDDSWWDWFDNLFNRDYQQVWRPCPNDPSGMNPEGICERGDNDGSCIVKACL